MAAPRQLPRCPVCHKPVRRTSPLGPPPTYDSTRCRRTFERSKRIRASPVNRVLPSARLVAGLFLGYSFGTARQQPMPIHVEEPMPNVSLELLRMQHEKEMEQLRAKRPLYGRGGAPDG